MIEKIHTTSSDSSSSMGIECPTCHHKERGSPGSHRLSLTAKSLMEVEDEDDEEEEPSRTPSLVVVGGRKDRRSHSRGRKGLLDSNNATTTTTTETRDAISDNVMHCEPSIVPLCQDGIHMFPSCQGNALAEQLDMMTQCHPLELFSMFHDPRVSHDDTVDHLLPGMHELPRTCEYCGASDTNLCTPECQRPKSFFRKKRPPFCPPDPTMWDPVTDYGIERPRPPPQKKQNEDDQLHQGVGSFFNFGDLF